MCGSYLGEHIVPLTLSAHLASPYLSACETRSIISTRRVMMHDDASRNRLHLLGAVDSLSEGDLVGIPFFGWTNDE
jgi:hypothetical protein